ncbi:ATP-binding protein [uncultured Methanoregula sp.]|uniref:sensor histidine kinase n=1 Tax=uncultured Methanoregula sp. TaxID=1005933 RepID=UPI002AAB9A1A|nr:ATP-binding protein [uncultured Methanoregula sp.]
MDDIAILLVDDDPDFLEMSRILLEEQGFRDFTLARSSEEVLVLLKTRSFDVIVADYELPPGTNSIILLKTLKAQGNETPFIIFTGKGREEVAIEALNSGAAYYLQKGTQVELQFAELRNMILQLAEKKRAKETVERQEIELRLKNEELESFCYSISHDLRAPLRVIDGYCGVIHNIGGKGLDPNVQKYLTGIRAASVKMNTMIESLLKFSRAGRLALDCQEVDLSKMVWEFTTDLREQQPGRDVTIDIDEGMVVYGDRTLISMAVQNLVDNSWKFTGKTSQAQIKARMTSDAGQKIFSVSDNGAGFDAAQAENLFRPFTRFHTESEFPGTGIGVATVQRIIERHGGRIWAESQVGKGATFSFTLPDCRNRAAGAASHDREPK